MYHHASLNLPSQASPSLYFILLNNGRHSSQLSPVVFFKQSHFQLSWKKKVFFWLLLNQSPSLPTCCRKYSANSLCVLSENPIEAFLSIYMSNTSTPIRSCLLQWYSLAFRDLEAMYQSRLTCIEMKLNKTLSIAKNITITIYSGMASFHKKTKWIFNT